jgi:cytochrome c553
MSMTIATEQAMRDVAAYIQTRQPAREQESE